MAKCIGQQYGLKMIFFIRTPSLANDGVGPSLANDGVRPSLVNDGVARTPSLANDGVEVNFQ